MEPIRLEPYNPNWKLTFETEKKQIQARLGDKVKRIHHVGSTAVEDLRAKPIIDIAIEASEFPPTEATVAQLQTLGYRYQGESGVKERIWFTKGDPRKVNLHYCAVHSPVVTDQLIFRDALRRNEKLRRSYESLKIENLLGKDIDDREYALSKTKLIEQILNGYQ